MPDYKQMYLTLLDSVETAVEMLKNVEQACEEIYIDTDETQEQKKRGLFLAFYDFIKFIHCVGVRL